MRGLKLIKPGAHANEEEPPLLHLVPNGRTCEEFTRAVERLRRRELPIDSVREVLRGVADLHRGPDEPAVDGLLWHEC